jgi:hypothetical protein
MISDPRLPYIRCPRFKGRPRKHVSVCSACRYRKNCPAYRRYRQPELPFEFGRGRRSTA